MTLDTIIKEAGLKACQFPKASNISVEVFDGKNQRLSEVHYIEEIFSKNEKSKVEFFNFLNYLEANMIESMKLKIDEDFVNVYYGTSSFSFRRSQSGNPIDIS